VEVIMVIDAAHAASVLPPAYRRHAGHAAHFLRRLDRVDDRQVELALALYNDPELVRATLARASLPEHAERVAISLDDPQEGPFVVVTREGRFVTCLGAGMRQRHPVLTRVQLEAAARQVERMRERLAQITQAEKHRGRTRKMITDVIQGGEDVSREQMESLLRWEPLLGEEFVIGLATYGSMLLSYAPRVRSIQTPKPRYAPLFRAYHEILYALGHLYVLAGASEVSRAWMERMSDAPLPMSLTGYASAFDVGYLTSRAMWAVARWPALMPVQKRMMRTADGPMELSDGYLGVAAIGLGKRSLRAEAQRAIASERSIAPSLEARATAHRSTLAMAFTHPEQVAEWGMSRGRLALSERVPGLAMDDVSDADARAQLASAPGHAAHTADDISASAIALPSIVRAAAHELYLPRRTIDAIKTPWSMAKTIALLNGHRAAYGVRKPVTVEPTAGRNEPCPCGSGHKRKRCCVPA
jgi:hypothetical protein